MKPILMLLIVAHSHAGLFENDKEQVRQYQQQLTQERQSTGAWQIATGLVGIGAIILFGVGAGIGSKVRKGVKRK